MSVKHILQVVTTRHKHIVMEHPLVGEYGPTDVFIFSPQDFSFPVLAKSKKELIRIYILYKI